MEKIMLLEDSRQQAKKHNAKHTWFLKNGISWTREMLSCGDYQVVGNNYAAVDTKKDIQELIGDIQVKTIPKKDIKTAISNFLTEEQERKHAKMLLEIITAEDANRDVEHEITMYCYENNLPESIIGRLQKLYVGFRGFFHRGLVRAKNRHIQLYILVASDPELLKNTNGKVNKAVTCINDLNEWVNPRSLIVKRWTNRDKLGNRSPIYAYPHAMSGERLAKALNTMEIKYGCKFVFCRNKDMGRKIIELLTGIVM